ncbi:hypothetical protein PAXINDRAFT_6893 [Paxillus involutus ATCC 200175]|nr:hypothetical protein PAXINDRAFT_6893 [Paxillus involutus ATCC 200175]
MSSPPPSCDSERENIFSISLTVYAAVKKTVKGKVTTKEEKSVKTKELLIAISDSNYIDFLQSVLAKHGQDQYKIMERKRYPIKYVPPKAKSQRSSDAMDVDNEADYKEMVKKIHDMEPPGMIKIYVDMKHVEKLPRHQGLDSGEDTRPSDDDDQENAARTLHQGASDLDSRLARWHIKLEKEHKNERDEGFTYVGPFGAIALTPAMILDWCRALEEGQATLKTPPNIESFNIANKAPVLHPAHIGELWPLVIHSSSVNSFTSPNSLACSKSSDPYPYTVRPNSGPPLVPTPSQLSRFLQYAETCLGVRHASTYEPGLQLHGIGPDILPDIDDKTLAGVGISAGDIIRLKKGSVVWWNSPDAKRKRSDTITATGTGSPFTSPDRPARKRVSYEKRYHDGGASRFSGPPMTVDEDDGLGDGVGTKDYTVFYRSNVHQQWLPVPHGFVVDEEEDLDTNEANLFQY